MPPLKIYCDCQAVVDGTSRGEEWCSSSARAHSDLWREFWFLVSDLGGLGPRTIQIIKIQARATRAQRREIGER
eukprot:6367175-Pyramimonas_sp.AAC.1